MLSLHEKSHFTNLSDYLLQPAVTALLNLRIAQLTRADGIDLADVTHFLVIQPGDTMAAVEREVGFRRTSVHRRIGRGNNRAGASRRCQ